MTEFQRYLAEEVAEDHADGLVSRREALRRLGLLGLGGAAAASLLAAVRGGRGEGGEPRSADGARARGGGRRPPPSRRATITFAGPQGGPCGARGRRRRGPRAASS